MSLQVLRFQRELLEAALRLASGATIDDLFHSIAPVALDIFALRRLSLQTNGGIRREIGGAAALANAAHSRIFSVVADGRDLGAIEVETVCAEANTTLVGAIQQLAALFSVALARDENVQRAAVQGDEWRSLFDEHPAPLLVYALNSAEILAANSAFCERYGYDPDELPGRRFTEVCIPDAHYNEQDSEMSNPAVRCRHYKRDGTRLDVEVTTRYCLWMGRTACIALINDITSRTRIERRLVQSEQRLERVQEIGGVGIFEVDLRTGHRYWSKELRRQFGYGEDCDPPCTPNLDATFVHPNDRELVRGAYEQAVKERSTCRVDHRVVQPSGAVLWLQLQADFDYDERGDPIRAIGTTVDITDGKSAEAQLAFLAHYDPLTGLTNRSNAMARLQNLIQVARRKRLTPALLFIDIDHLKEVNDTMGHDAGDQVLIEVGRRIGDVLRENDCVARMGGDEFVVILADSTDSQNAQMVARRIASAVQKPMLIADQQIVLTCSIGIALFPTERIDVETLVSRADMAMYQSKRDGRNRISFYEDEMLRAMVQRFETETELRRALERNEFSLLYQPIVSISKGKVTGVEALIRWHHPSGIRLPVDFIGVAEESDVIGGIGAWVLREACLQGVRWLEVGLNLSMLVNVSRREIVDPGFGHRVIAILDETGFDPKMLQLELTETTLVNDLESVQTMLFSLRQAGIRIALDDFGTGFNSLTNLRYPVIDALKIDRSFISNISTSPSDMAIAGAVVSAGRSLGVCVVAEGVETEEQFETLRRLSCDEAQGYWFSEPIEAAALRDRKQEIESGVTREGEPHEARWEAGFA